MTGGVDTYAFDNDFNECEGTCTVPCYYVHRAPLVILHIALLVSAQFTATHLAQSTADKCRVHCKSVHTSLHLAQCTAVQEKSPKATAPDIHSLKSIGCT